MSAETVRAVHDAARALTLACSEAVGPISLAIAMPGVAMTGAPLPAAMLRRVREIEARERRR